MTMASSFSEDDGIAITVLAAVIHLDRHARQPLDHVLASQGRMPARAAGHDLNRVQVLELVLGDFHLLQKDLAGIQRDAAQPGIADGARLLKDFLEHEVLEAALLGHDGVPGDVLHLPHDRFAFKVAQLHAGRGDDCQVAVGQEEQIAGVIEDGRHVGGDKVLVLAQADHRRRAVAGGDDLVALVA